MVNLSISRICTIFLLIHTGQAFHQTLVRRTVDGIQLVAARKTYSLAKDLRMAFGGILPRAMPSSTQPRHVVYCKPAKQAPVRAGHGPTGSRGNKTISNIGTGTIPVTRTSGSRPTGSVPFPTATSPWKISQSHSGSTFFNGWGFDTFPDPTHGIVEYIDENAARSSGLLDVNSDGNAIMRVETTPTVSGNRKSVRITSKSAFNGGLVIMDAVHMPTGCGVWPAFWTNGPNWPNGGEIDIVEGVHDYTRNQATLHTNPGCRLTSSSASSLAISGSVIGGVDCSALDTGNQGCGIRASTTNSFGSGFNANGGGVYAMKWDTSGIAIYFFPRGSIPNDITAENPLPDTWGRAQARWPAASCDPFRFFSDHRAIFDTTLCGDWAGGVWSASGIPGQEQSCAQRTGFPTCEAFVRANGGSMSEAYWEVKYVKIFQLKN